MKKVVDQPGPLVSDSHPDTVIVRPYAPASFLTPHGALLKVLQLRRKGFPDLSRSRWLFTTLTVDPKRYLDPEKAYEFSLRHLRQFIWTLRKRGFAIERFAWKLEFQEPDEQARIYAHFHLLLEYNRYIPPSVVDSAWGKGRTHIVGVDDSERAFNYITKPVLDLPEWFSCRPKVRLWQTSPGFFNRKLAASVSPTDQGRQHRPKGTRSNVTQGAPRKETVAERLLRWQRRCTIIITHTKSGMTFYRGAELATTWNYALTHLAKKSLEFNDRLRGRQDFIVSGYKVQLPDQQWINKLLPLKTVFRPVCT